MKYTVPVQFRAISYYDVEAATAIEAEIKVKTLLSDGEEPLLREETEIPGDFEILTDSITSD